MPAALDAALLGGWVTAAVATLERHAAEVDRINVFPVADRDTGTNLLLTLRAAAAEPWEVPVRATGFAGPAAGGAGGGGVAAGGVGAAATAGGDVRDAGSRTGVGPLTVARAAALARGALRGARGNSGVLLSQVFRGLAEAVAHAAAAVPAPAGAPSGAAAPGERDGAVLADGLTRAAALAAAAVSRPREGTVLTVLAAAAAAARAAAGVGRVGPAAAGEHGVGGSDPAGAGRPGSAAAGEYGVDGWDPGGTGRVGAVDAGGVADRSGPVGAGGAGLLAPPGVGEGRDAESGGTGGTGRLALVATAAADAAGAVLLTTTARLPELARARVVDAGGLGLHLVLDALAVLLTGRPPAVPRTEAAAGPPGGAGTEEGVGSDGDAGTAGAGEGAGGIDDGSRTGVAAPIGVPAPTGVGGRTATPVHGTPSPVGRGPARPGPAAVGYEVMYLLDGSDDRRAAALRGLLDALGDAVAVVGDGAEGGRGTWTVHVHCADIGAALEAGLAAGRPHAVRVAPLVERDDDPAAGHGGPAGPRATPPTGRPGPGGGPAAVGDAHAAGDAGTGDGPGGAAECGVPVVARAVVALVGGPEVAALAAAAGAHVVRYDGPTAAASAAVGAGHGGAAGAGGTADGATGAGETPDGGTGDGGPA
ncbi:MAG TPA: DAK2 domain-containing protein, partial [Pseudonocardia sp.]